MSIRKLNKRIRKKIVKLAISGKTDNQILQVIPTISQSSVTKVKKDNQAIIQAKKEKYIKLIDKLIGDEKQAKVLEGITKAKTEIYNFKGDVVGVRDDYKIQLEGIKYIDKLKGREQQSIKLSQTNNYISKELDKYIS